MYGLGLGYYYEAAYEWLEKSKSKERYLIFLEDDLEVIRLFLETELASKILNDKQARLFSIDWENINRDIDEAIANFPFKRTKVSALESYLQQKIDQFHDIEI